MSDVEIVPTMYALAEYLDDIALARYFGTGKPTPTNLPTVMFGPGFDTPEHAVILNYYDENRDDDVWNPTLYIQFRFRMPKANRNPLAVHEVADRFFHALDTDHLTPQPTRLHLPGGVPIQSMVRRAATDATPDDAGRWTRADSYRLIVNPTS